MQVKHSHAINLDLIHFIDQLTALLLYIYGPNSKYVHNLYGMLTDSRFPSVLHAGKLRR